jgi:hypothetical protein
MDKPQATSMESCTLAPPSSSARTHGPRTMFKGRNWQLFLVVIALGASCSRDIDPAEDLRAQDADTATQVDAGSDTAAQDDADTGPQDDVDTTAQDDTDTGSQDEEGALSCAEMSANCASEFGSLFGKSNGRADGTLLALVEPTDSQCELHNGTHVVLQVSILGHVQRLVVSVDAVSVTSLTAPLIGPAYAEGWHVDQHLDYVTDLGVHSTDFTQTSMDEAVSFICSELEVDAPVSVFAYATGEYPASAHQIHRNDNYPDGAVVARPDSDTPLYLLFRYSDQTF